MTGQYHSVLSWPRVRAFFFFALFSSYASLLLNMHTANAIVRHAWYLQLVLQVILESWFLKENKICILVKIANDKQFWGVLIF